MFNSKGDNNYLPFQKTNQSINEQFQDKKKLAEFLIRWKCAKIY